MKKFNEFINSLNENVYSSVDFLSDEYEKNIKKINEKYDDKFTKIIHEILFAYKKWDIENNEDVNYGEDNGGYFIDFFEIGDPMDFADGQIYSIHYSGKNKLWSVCGEIYNEGYNKKNIIDMSVEEKSGLLRSLHEHNMTEPLSKSYISSVLKKINKG